MRKQVATTAAAMAVALLTGAALVAFVIPGATALEGLHLRPSFLECSFGTSVSFTKSSVTVNGFEGSNPTITENMIFVSVSEEFLERGKGMVSVVIDRINGSIHILQGKTKMVRTCHTRASRAF